MSDQLPLIRHPVWPLTDIREPHKNDVLCGRGGGAQNHVGNYQYRRLVNDSKMRYLTASKKLKPIVAREVVATIYRMEPPGRFLELSTTTGSFFDIGEAKSAQKVSQALREGAPEIRKQLEQLKASGPTLTSMSPPAPQNTTGRTPLKGMTVAHFINRKNCDQSSGAAGALTLKAVGLESSNFNPHIPDVSVSAVQNIHFNSTNERRPVTGKKKSDEIRKQIEKLAASNRQSINPPRSPKRPNWRLPSDELGEKTEKALMESDGILGLGTPTFFSQGMVDSLRSLNMDDEEELSSTREKVNRKKMHSLEMPGSNIFPDEKYDYVPPAPLVAPTLTHFNPNFDSVDTDDRELLKSFKNGSFGGSNNNWLSKSSLLSSNASKMSCKSIDTFPMDGSLYSGRSGRERVFSIDSSNMSLKTIETFAMEGNSISGSSLKLGPETRPGLLVSNGGGGPQFSNMSIGTFGIDETSLDAILDDDL
eukprot:CAMPEP_0194265862 /NCGR_PEP_ID=MMETSP0169-20130528/961_1 /TAXON_ID=218684 /ORGANISM="Corethron pennatum, Strain L29A3" /LENGTH=476 /DNA_ID=CAMNT_0039006421 /DNA_START=111 /DNA_END=1541 /DNA_ORIENTATION=-